MPRLRISNYYKDLSNSMEDDGSLTKDYIMEKVKAGQWLLKSIEQRQKTIYRVTKSILRFQKKFFDKGIHFFRPLVLKDVAEDIEMQLHPKWFRKWFHFQIVNLQEPEHCWN